MQVRENSSVQMPVAAVISVAPAPAVCVQQVCADDNRESVSAIFHSEFCPEPCSYFLVEPFSDRYFAVGSTGPQHLHAAQANFIATESKVSPMLSVLVSRRTSSAAASLISSLPCRSRWRYVRSQLGGKGQF